MNHMTAVRRFAAGDAGAVAAIIRGLPDYFTDDAARRGRGHGTRLLGHVLDHLAIAGISVVEAKTLDRSAGYRPYEATRAFWERSGFIQVDTIDPLPGWAPGNPAAIYVAALRPTR
jgi:GNAT superfamily N-acetyltransferase